MCLESQLIMLFKRKKRIRRVDNFIICFVTEICFNFILKKSLAWIWGSSEGKNLCPKTFAAAHDRRSDTEADGTSCLCSSVLGLL